MGQHIVPMRIGLRTMATWTPDLSGKKGPKYKLIADAIGSAVGSGEIKPGMRLPTHRNLADHLKLTVGTITRGYAEAARRGLIEGETGRGTYVKRTKFADPIDVTNSTHSKHLNSSTAKTALIREWPNRPIKRLVTSETNQIDTKSGRPKHSANKKPQPQRQSKSTNEPTTGSLLSLLTAPLLHTMRQCLMQPTSGSTRATNTELAPRELGRKWLMPLGIGQSSDTTTIMTNGSEAVLPACMTALAQSGVMGDTNVVLVDAEMDPALLTPLARVGVETQPILSDSDGIHPESLELAAWTSSARVLLIMPALQSPSLTVIPEARRRSIADAARKFNLTIVELEGLARRLGPGHTPVAKLAPERTIYISSLAKLFSDWVTAGFVALPKQFEGKVKNAVEQQSGAVNPLFGTILHSWAESGLAHQVELAIQAEAVARTAMATLIFADQDARFGGLHGWLRCQESGLKNRSIAELNRQTRNLLSIGQSGPDAVTLSLSNTETTADLQRALVDLKNILFSGDQPG
jgi:DNA-binding transcriptional MocR family regulator